MLMKELGDMAVGVDGRVNSYDRKKLIDKFYNDDTCKVFVGNIVAAGVGVNLVNASEVIFCNMPFTAAEVQQCVDRLHRIGQDKPINVYYTICMDTIDEAIYRMIEHKAEDILNVVDSGKGNKDVGNIPARLFKMLLNEKRLCDT